MASKRGREQFPSGNFTTPEENAEPSFQHPADHSWVLQGLLDIKQSIGKLDERTDALKGDLSFIRNDIASLRKDMVSKGGFWLGIGIVISLMGVIVAIVIGMGQIYYAGKSAPSTPSAASPPVSQLPKE